MNLSLVILAAGIGHRYGGLKQVDPVGPSGEIVVDYSVFDAMRAGFDRVVFVIRREIEPDFRSTIGARIASRLPVRYVYQELADLPAPFTPPADRKRPWGTGHAVLAARAAVDGPFAAINADDFYGAASYRLLADGLRRCSLGNARYCMVAFVLRNTLSEHGSVARGICQVTDAGLLGSVVERTRIEKQGDGARAPLEDGSALTLTGDEPVSMNMWGFTATVFGFLEEGFARFLARSGRDLKAEFFVPSVVDELIRERRATVDVLTTPEQWAGVTYPQDKPAVVEHIRKLIAAGVYPPRLWG